MTLDAGDTKLSMAGACKAMLSGSTGSLKASLAGSCKIEGEELKSETSKISISGAGKVTIHAEKELDVSIAGSGKVYYKGNPEISNARVSGSGNVSKL